MESCKQAVKRLADYALNDFCVMLLSTIHLEQKMTYLLDLPADHQSLVLS